MQNDTLAHGATDAADGASDAAERDLSFEEARRELEEIVSTLEAGNVPLEQTLSLMQRGMALGALCDATLAQAEATLEKLVANADGELVTERVTIELEEEEDLLADE